MRPSWGIHHPRSGVSLLVKGPVLRMVFLVLRRVSHYLTTLCNGRSLTLSRPSTQGTVMARDPERVKVALRAAVERRTELHTRMVKGEISLADHRAMRDAEDAWIDRLLGELSRASA